MKKTILSGIVLALLPLLGAQVDLGTRNFTPASSGPVPTVIHATLNGSNIAFGAGSLTLSPAATAGNKLIVVLFNGAGSVTTVTDQSLTSLTLCGAQQPLIGGVNGGDYSNWEYTVPPGGTTTLNFTFTSGDYLRVVALEVTGLTDTTCQAQGADDSNYGQTNPTATPSASPSLAIAAYIIDGSSLSFTPTSGWTEDGAVTNPAAGIMYVEHRAAAGTSPVNSAMTYSPAPQYTDSFVTIW